MKQDSSQFYRPMRIIINVSELELLIARSTYHISLTGSKNRFQLVFFDFLQVLPSRTPTSDFLDNLQWADEAFLSHEEIVQNKSKIFYDNRAYRHDLERDHLLLRFIEEISS